MRKRVGAGRLHRVHAAVYSLVPVEMLTVRGGYRAAVLACTGSRRAAALSHRSAADLHGLRVCQRRVVEVIVPGRSTHRHPGIQVHRSVNLAEPDTTALDGIRVTTVARTLLDLAALCRAHRLPPPEFHAAIDPGDGGVLLRPDAVRREHRLAVEVDGERVHRTHRAFHDDRRRDQRLVAAGWRVIRITWPQLDERPRELAALLARMLA